jgi:serine/threonine-protein kinase
LALTVVEVAKGDEVIVGDHAAMMGTILDPGRRPTPRTEGLEVSDQVEGVFERALAVDPRKRYQTVQAFWDALTVALDIQDDVGGPLSLQLQPSRRGVTTDFDVVPLSEPGEEGLALSLAPPGAGAHAGGGPSVQGATAGAYESEHLRIGAALKVPTSLEPESSGGFGGGLQSVTSQARPRSFRPAVSYAPVGREPILKALAPALSLVALSVALTLLDRAFAHSRGIPLSFGPVRASWVAGGVMVVAIFVAVAAIRRHWED